MMRSLISSVDEADSSHVLARSGYCDMDQVGSEENSNRNSKKVFYLSWVWGKSCGR
jgi:hypothetical protein